MHNLNNTAKNHTCYHCGRDAQSYKIGVFIKNALKKLHEMDKQIDAVNVLIPFKKFLDTPQNFARLIYNPWK
ncbi:hypothetical protein ACKGJN_06240 [Gillisia sp. Q332]